MVMYLHFISCRWSIRLLNRSKAQCKFVMLSAASKQLNTQVLWHRVGSCHIDDLEVHFKGVEHISTFIASKFNPHFTFRDNSLMPGELPSAI